MKIHENNKIYFKFFGAKAKTTIQIKVNKILPKFKKMTFHSRIRLIQEERVQPNR